MKSEFKKYLHFTYIELRTGYFTLETQRFIKKNTKAEFIKRVEDAMELGDELSSNAIKSGDIDILKEVNNTDNQIEQLIANMDFGFIARNYLLN